MTTSTSTSSSVGSSLSSTSHSDTENSKHTKNLYECNKLLGDDVSMLCVDDPAAKGSHGLHLPGGLISSVLAMNRGHHSSMIIQCLHHQP